MFLFAKPLKVQAGFTLAELLISLAILGVIATFTIPKILATQQAKGYNTAAKELASTLSALYVNEYTKNGGESWVQANSGLDQNSMVNGGNFNYVSRISGVYMTYPPGGAAAVRGGDNYCNSNAAWVSCYLLHNGGVLWYHRSPFNWSGLYIWDFQFDPDGVGPSESVSFILYTSSRVTSLNPTGSIPPGRIVTYSGMPTGSGTWWFVGPPPSWFSWQ